jgi:hypothetical protein
MVSRDEYFFQYPKNQNRAFLNESWWFSQFLAAFLWRTSKTKFLLAFILTYCENPSSNLLQMLWSGDFDHQTHAVIKYSTASRLGHVQLRGFFLHPMRGGHWRKSTNDRGMPVRRNYEAAFGTIFWD